MGGVDSAGQVMRGVETRGLRQGEGVGEATTKPLSGLKSCKSSAFQRGVGQVWALDCHAQNGGLLFADRFCDIYWNSTQDLVILLYIRWAGYLQRVT